MKRLILFFSICVLFPLIFLIFTIGLYSPTHAMNADPKTDATTDASPKQEQPAKTKSMESESGDTKQHSLVNEVSKKIGKTPDWKDIVLLKKNFKSKHDLNQIYYKKDFVIVFQNTETMHKLLVDGKKSSISGARIGQIISLANETYTLATGRHCEYMVNMDNTKPQQVSANLLRPLPSAGSSTHSGSTNLSGLGVSYGTCDTSGYFPYGIFEREYSSDD